MDKKTIQNKLENHEDLTIEEVIFFKENFHQEKEVYGKYGNIAKTYIDENFPEKSWTMGDDYPVYLHNIDKQAEDLFEVMYNKLSKKEEYKKTGDYLSDLRKETEIRKKIEDEILNELVYVK